MNLGIRAPLRYAVTLPPGVPYLPLVDTVNRSDTDENLGTASEIEIDWTANLAFRVLDNAAAADEPRTATANCTFLGSRFDWSPDQGIVATLLSTPPDLSDGSTQRGWHRGVCVRNEDAASVGDENYPGVVEAVFPDEGDPRFELRVYWAGPAGFPYKPLFDVDADPVVVDAYTPGSGRIAVVVTGVSPPRLRVWYDPDGSGFPDDPQVDAYHTLDEGDGDSYYTEGPPGLTAYRVAGDEALFDDVYAGPVG